MSDSEITDKRTVGRPKADRLERWGITLSAEEVEMVRALAKRLHPAGRRALSETIREAIREMYAREIGAEAPASR